MERIALEVGAPPREYRLFRPGPRATPLVVFLPGMGATAEWADDETGWSRLAGREGFALAIPEGLPPDPARPPTFLTNPPRWNDGSPQISEPGTRDLVSNPSRDVAPPLDDVSFLAAVIDDAANRTGADPRRVFVSGFSNGAGMAFRLAAERADRVAAVAPVAGYCWVDPKPARPVPTLYAVGTTDPLVPLRGGEVRSPWQHRYVRRPPVADTLERWARAIGCEPVPRAEDPSPLASLAAPPPGGEGLKAPEASPPSLLGKGAGGLGRVRVDTYPGPVPFRVVTVAGLGHHWPGGKGRFNPRIAGPLSDSVNGTELVWEFFKEIV